MIYWLDGVVKTFEGLTSNENEKELDTPYKNT